jgi:hypothetical protein
MCNSFRPWRGRGEAGPARLLLGTANGEVMTGSGPRKIRTSRPAESSCLDGSVSFGLLSPETVLRLGLSKEEATFVVLRSASERCDGLVYGS